MESNQEASARQLAATRQRRSRVEKQVELMESFLTQPTPRRNIPRPFLVANKHNSTNTHVAVGIVIAVGLLAVLPAAVFLLSGASFSEILTTPFSLSVVAGNLLAAIIIIPIICFYGHQARVRSRLLRWGKLTEGRVDCILHIGTKTTGASRPDQPNGEFYGPSTSINKYRVIYTYPWEEKERQASQVLYELDDQREFDYPYDFRAHDESSPVRLLVDPRNPDHLLWVNATLLSHALPPSSGGD